MTTPENTGVTLEAVLSNINTNVNTNKQQLADDQQRIKDAERRDTYCRISFLIIFLVCIIGSMVMFGFSVDGDVKFADVREISCNATKIEVVNQSVMITADFSIVAGVKMTEIIQIKCEEAGCTTVLEDYKVGSPFICYWYPGSEILAIESNYVVASAVLTVFSIILCMCCCGWIGVVLN